MPPPPPAAEAVAQKAGDVGPGSEVPLLQALQPGVRRTIPRAASTAASGVAAASRAAATHGLGGGADPARVRSNRQLQNARKRAKQLEYMRVVMLIKKTLFKKVLFGLESRLFWPRWLR